MRWCRLYSEFATDPKVQIMPEAMQRRLIMLFCFHAEGTLEGMTDETLGFSLHVNATELRKTQELFVKQGFLDEGSWTPRNWAKRQRTSDDTNSRVKRYRERHSSDSNGNVTLQKLNSSVTVTGGGFPPGGREIPGGKEGSPEGGKGDPRERGECNVTSPLQSPPIHSTDSPAAQKVRDDAVRRWGDIDIDADMQANELIRCWGDKLAAHGLDKAFRALGSKEKPWAWANKVCQGGMPRSGQSNSKTPDSGPTNQPVSAQNLPGGLEQFTERANRNRELARKHGFDS